MSPPVTRTLCALGAKMRNVIRRSGRTSGEVTAGPRPALPLPACAPGAPAPPFWGGEGGGPKARGLMANTARTTPAGAARSCNLHIPTSPQGAKTQSISGRGAKLNGWIFPPFAETIGLTDWQSTPAAYAVFFTVA